MPAPAKALIERYYRREVQQLALRLAEAYPLTDADLDRLGSDDQVLDFAERLIRSRTPRWLMGWRDICRSTDERTVIAGGFPQWLVNTAPVVFQYVVMPIAAALHANLCSLANGLRSSSESWWHIILTIRFCLRQFPFFPSAYSKADLAFITPRVLELTYTAEDMRPFAEDLGYDGPPYPWDPDRRALLKAELDAYYAYLYGLSRDELRYILDPADVYGPDYPSETFRVLKEKETREFGEYRTRRLVLEAYDRFAADGTFDPARLSDACYFETVKTALSTTKAKLAELEATYKALLDRADATSQPTLFVEGATDAVIIAAAWKALYPASRRRSRCWRPRARSRWAASPAAAKRCASCWATALSARSPTTTPRAAPSWMTATCERAVRGSSRRTVSTGACWHPRPSSRRSSSACRCPRTIGRSPSRRAFRRRCAGRRWAKAPTPSPASRRASSWTTRT